MSSRHRQHTAAHAAATPLPTKDLKIFKPTRGRAIAGRVTVLLGLAVIWQLISGLRIVDPTFLPSPITVLGAVPEVFSQEQVWEGLRATGFQVAVAFIFTASLGILTGILFGLSPLIYDCFYGFVSFALSTPTVLFLPICLLLFGITDLEKIVFGALSAFPYVVINVTNGVKLLDDTHRRLGYAFNAPFTAYLRDIVMPSALPGIFAGLWLGLRQSLVGVLVAQLFTSAVGIGFLVKIYSANFRTERTLCVIFTVAIIAVIAGSIWSRVERKLQSWRESI